MALNVFNVVELGGQGVFSVNDNDFPVGLLLIEQGHHTKNLDLFNLTWVADELSDFAHVERVIIALGLGLGVDNVRVFPCLEKLSSGYRHSVWQETNLREGSIIPKVALVRKAVSHKAELPLLDILFDGVQLLLFRDLDERD